MVLGRPHSWTVCLEINWSQKQDALQVVTREADAFWQLLVQAGCRIQEIEVNNRSLLDTIFEKTQKGDD